MPRTRLSLKCGAHPFARQRNTQREKNGHQCDDRHQFDQREATRHAPLRIVMAHQVVTEPQRPDKEPVAVLSSFNWQSASEPLMPSAVSV